MLSAVFMNQDLFIIKGFPWKDTSTKCFFYSFFYLSRFVITKFLLIFLLLTLSDLKSFWIIANIYRKKKVWELIYFPFTYLYILWCRSSIKFMIYSVSQEKSTLLNRLHSQARHFFLLFRAVHRFYKGDPWIRLQLRNTFFLRCDGAFHLCLFRYGLTILDRAVTPHHRQ